MSQSTMETATNRKPSAATLLWILLFIIACFKILRRTVEQSMFFDGLIYASIARNMAEDNQSIWYPKFSETLFPLFSEHPPLLMWLEALAYRAFGDGIWVEKAYSLSTALISGLIFLAIWRRINKEDPELRDAGAVPLILCLIGGRIGWAYSNNMLENTLIIFTLLSIYLIIFAYSSPNRQNFISRFPFIFVSGLAISLAILTKGPVGLFPLATIGLYFIAFGRPSIRATIEDTFIVLAIVAGVIAFLWALPEPRAYIERYFNLQVMASISGERGSDGGGWRGVRTFLRMIIYPVLVSGAIIYLRHFLKRNAAEKNFTPRSRFAAMRVRNTAFFIMVGASASLPLFVSPRIYSFYFNPSIPFFAAALATICVPAILFLIESLNVLWLRRVRLALIVGATASLTMIGFSIAKPGSDQTMLEDVHKIGDHVCPEDNQCVRILATCDSVWNHWQLHAYFQRYYRISLANEDVSVPDKGRYLISHRDCPPDEVNSYTELDIGLKEYQLLTR